MTSPPTTWKLTLSYDGTPFHGWQVQPGHATIQGALAAAILRIAGERVLPQGSGRTDAGVHALAQVASFTLAAPIPPANLLRALNRTLPPSIRILAAEPAPSNFHARHSALRKTYEYRIFECRRPEPRTPEPSSASAEPSHPFLHGLIASVWGETADPLTTDPTTAAPFTEGPIVPGWDETTRGETEQPAGAPFMSGDRGPQRAVFARRGGRAHGWGETPDRTTGRICPPFLAPFVWDCRWPLQLDLMQRAADQLLGAHDFTSFAAIDPDLTQRATPPPDPNIPCRAQNASHPERRPASLGGPESKDPEAAQPAPAAHAFSTSQASPSREPEPAPNPIKTIFTSTLVRENNLLLYRVTGSGFLHHMVRNIVGTLVEIGRGRLTPDDLPHILAARDRSAAGPTAPARGLFLVSVAYERPEAQP